MWYGNTQNFGYNVDVKINKENAVKEGRPIIVMSEIIDVMF